MCSLQNSLDLENFELVPRPETLPSPRSDSEAHFMTKPLKWQKENDNSDDNKTQTDREGDKMLREKQDVIRQLSQELSNAESMANLNKEANIVYAEVFQKIQHFLGLGEIRVEQLPVKIENIFNELKIQIIDLKQKEEKRKKEFSNPDSQILSRVIKQKENTIKKLKEQLLQSTKNNINAIFHSEITAQECLNHEIITMKEEIVNIKKTHLNKAETDRITDLSKHECPHHQKLTTLINNYQQMLEQYRRNQKFVANLQARQEESFSYFSALKSDLSYTLQETCRTYSDQKMNSLQEKVKEALNRLSIPEKVKTQHDNDIRVRELLAEIDRLNEKLTKKQLQIYNITKKYEEEACTRSWNQYHSSVSKVNNLQQKIRQKDKRISQLQQTIIEQIDSKPNIQSINNMESRFRSTGTINSQESDLDKQKNNVRNLKTLVAELKKQNSKLKEKLNEKTANSCSQLGMAQRVLIDEGGNKIAEIILEALISTNKGMCKCLEQVTDVIMGYSDQIPELEQMMISLGVIETSATVLGTEGIVGI